MAINTSDLEYIESMAGYGSKASVFKTDLGLCIEVGKIYDGIGWFGGSIRLTDEEVDLLDTDKTKIIEFAEEASNRFRVQFGETTLK